MKDIIEYFFFYLFSLFFRILGVKKARKLSGLIAFLFFYIIPIRKTVVIENLYKAFPKMYSREVKRVAYESYKSFAITLIEILCIPSISTEEMINSVKMKEGSKELIKNLLSQNKGLLIFTAHFGNWEYAAISSSLQISEPIYVIVKPQRNSLVDKWMNKAREKWLNKVIPLGLSIRNVYTELKKGHAIGIVGDQRGPSEGFRVNFFQKATSLYSGAGALHTKLGAPIIVGIPVRQPDYSYILEVLQIKTDEMSTDNETRIKEITQEYANILMSYIVEFPEQWLWMHKIWKY